MAALMLTAKGVPFIYYGEEIGMENIEANTLGEIKDIQARTQYNLAIKKGNTEEEALKFGNQHNRDKSRSPMQWNDEQLAGFSDSTSWIKVHQNYKILNVKNLSSDKSSLLNSYKKLIALRNSEPILQYGTYSNLSFTDAMISYTREFNGGLIKGYFNFSDSPKEIHLNEQEKVLLGTLTIEPDNYLIIKQKK